jgi:hypothetical protein
VAKKTLYFQNEKTRRIFFKALGAGKHNFTVFLSPAAIYIKKRRRLIRDKEK